MPDSLDINEILGLDPLAGRPEWSFIGDWEVCVMNRDVSKAPQRTQVLARAHRPRPGTYLELQYAPDTSAKWRIWLNRGAQSKHVDHFHSYDEAARVFVKALQAIRARGRISYKGTFDACLAARKPLNT